MLRLLRRQLTKDYLSEALHSLNLHLKPKSGEVASSSTKVKFSLKRTAEKKAEPEKDVFDLIRKLPNNSPDLPKDLAEKLENESTIKKLMKSRSDAYEKFINGMLTIPKEGVHYFSHDSDTEESKISNEQLRTYILNAMKKSKFSGKLFVNSKIPEHAMKPYDPKMVLTYPRVTSDLKIIDVNHWATWYLKNQPEDIKSLEESDWEPLMIDHDRFRNAKQIYKTFKTRKSSGSNNMMSKNESSGKSVNSTFQADIFEESIERVYETTNMYKSTPFIKFIQNSKMGSVNIHTALENPGDIPPTPPNVGSDLVSFNKSIESWSVFKSFPRIINSIQKWAEAEKKFQTDEPWVPVKLPSIYNYYETLPNYYKNNRLIQNVTIILEKYHPKIPRKRKELMLNRLCHLLTPRNPEKYKFLQEYYPINTRISTNLKETSEGELQEEPTQYKVKSEGEIQIEGSEEFSASDIEPKILQEIKKRSIENPDEDFLVKVAEFKIKNDEIPKEILEKFPELQKKNEERLKLILKQIYNEEEHQPVDLVEGTAGNSKWSKSRRKHTNITTGQTFEVEASADHLTLPADYIPLEIETEVEEKKIVDDKIESDIELEIDKKTGTIKEMHTFKNIGYEKNVKQLWKTKEELLDEEMDELEKAVDPDDDDDEDGEKKKKKADQYDSDELNELGSDYEEHDSDEPDSSGSDFTVSASEEDEEYDSDEYSDDDDFQDQDADEDEGDNEDGSEAEQVQKKDSDDYQDDEDYDDYDVSDHEDDSDPDVAVIGKRKKQRETPIQQLQNAMGEKVIIENDNEEYYKIYDRNIDWDTRNHENSDGPIPSSITFYDNKDGYWDHWIKIKRDRAGIPEIGSRPHFRH